YVALLTHYRCVPRWLWDCPLPVVAFAGDWNWLWHAYRRLAASCELMLTDTAGVEALRRAGFDHGRAAILYGAGSGDENLLFDADGDAPRDIDILFVGNLSPQVQPERLRWLGQIASLSNRWNVVIETGVFGEDYHRLLRRARIVFNRSLRDEWN